MYVHLSNEYVEEFDEEGTWFESEDPNAPVVLNIQNLTKSEFRTIMFGLEAYKDDLKATLDLYKQNNKDSADKTYATSIFGGPTFEDEAFCYHELSKVAQLQFELMENHDLETREQIATWSEL